MRQKDQGDLKLHFSVINSSPTLRINKKIDLEKWDFQHIFDDPPFFKGRRGYVNSENSDCDVSPCRWHTNAWSGSTYEQSEQVLALWDHLCSFQEIDDLQYLKFSIFRPRGTVKISCFQKNTGEKVLLCLKMSIFDKVNVFHFFCKKIELNPIICERVTNNKVQIFS